MRDIDAEDREVLAPILRDAGLVESNHLNPSTRGESRPLNQREIQHNIRMREIQRKYGLLYGEKEY